MGGGLASAASARVAGIQFGVSYRECVSVGGASLSRTLPYLNLQDTADTVHQIAESGRADRIGSGWARANVTLGYPSGEPTFRG